MQYFIFLILTSVLLSSCQTKTDVTNSNASVIEKQYDTRLPELYKLEDSPSPDAHDKFVQGVRDLIKDFPTEDSYMLMIGEIHTREVFFHDQKRARILAKEMMDGSAPEKYKSWAKGFLRRFDSMGKPVTMKFIAVDGREVDLAKMKGKVVLVDFWGTHCGPCVAELPRVKATYDKFRGQGFEVVGISCDVDKNDLEKFVKTKEIPWPQYFDGKQQSDNKFTIEFGIDGIPHMFLIDKKGCLRIDNVRAKGDFEEKIAKLLAEQ